MARGLHVVVVRVDVRTKLDLLDFDQLLALARLALFLLFLELELAVIEDLADRRVRIGGHLDEVERRLFRQSLRVCRFDDEPDSGLLRQ